MNHKTETTFKVFTLRGAREYPTYDEAVIAAIKLAKRSHRWITITQDQHTPGYYDGDEIARWNVSPWTGAVHSWDTEVAYPEYDRIAEGE